ncbi:MAG: cation:proton antiporter [Salinisphaera sp.]|nr:cation:proton antiporter [Salinisphaera sp.]
MTADPNPWLFALENLSSEAVLLRLLVQLAVILLAARVFAKLFRLVHQPGVVGEIAAGLALGPSLLGMLWPEAFAAIFHPQLQTLDPALSNQLFGWMLTGLSKLGVILLMFLIGLEFDYRHLKDKGRATVGISVSGVLLPFVLGAAVAVAMHPYVAAGTSLLGFTLFLAIALSITAVPVLGRMAMDLNITRTRVGAMAISAAAIDDATGWILLAAVAAIVAGQFQVLPVVAMVLQTIGFCALMFLIARPLLRRWAAHALGGDGELTLTGLAVLLVIVFVCAIATSWIGIFAVFGPFVLGAVLSDQQALCHAVSRRLGDFVNAFFVPIFFAYTGLRTDLGSLGSLDLWGWGLIILAAAVVGKLGGCALAARVTGSSWREAGCIGALMNTRALTALVVINIGKDMGVIPDTVFAMLVLMALITTVMTTPMLFGLMRGTELEAPVRGSGFFNPRRGAAAPGKASRK